MQRQDRPDVPVPAVGPLPDLQDDPAAKALSDELLEALQSELEARIVESQHADEADCWIPVPEEDPEPARSLAVAVRDGWKVAELRRLPRQYRITLHPVDLPPNVDEHVAEARLVAATMSVRVALRAHDAGFEVARLHKLLSRGLRGGSVFSGRHPRWAGTGLRTGVSELVRRQRELEDVARVLLYPTPLPRLPVPDLPVLRPVGPGATVPQLAGAVRLHLREHGLEAKSRAVAVPEPAVVVTYHDGPPTWVVEQALKHVEGVRVNRQSSQRAVLTAVAIFHVTYGRPPTTTDDVVEIERWLAFGDVLGLADRRVKRLIRVFTKVAAGLATDDVAVIAERYAELHPFAASTSGSGPSRR